MTKSTDLAVRYDNNLIINAPVSGNLHECRPLFIDEYGILLCASGSIIHAISSKTGELIGNFTGHTAIVTCIANCPPVADVLESSHQQSSGLKSSPVVVTSSIDGCLIVWNKKTFKEISRHFVGAPIYDIMIPSSAVNCEFLTGIPRIKASDAIEDMYPRDSEIYIICDCKVTASKPQPLPTDAVAKIAGDGDVPKAVEKSIENFVLYYYNTDGRKIRRNICMVRNIPQCIAPMGTLLGDKYVAIGGAKPQITFWSETAQKLTHVASPLGPVTCLAVQLDTGVLVTGHTNGEIIIYHGLADWLKIASAKGGRPPPPPTTSLLHWHAHAVSSLAMSPDARYLFSGGEEGVLVVWQLGTGLKDFLPRLGAGITYLSSSAKEARVAVTTSDNTVRIINTASMKEDWEMRSLFIPGPTPKASNSSLQKSVSTSQVFTQSDSNYRCTIKVESRSGYIGCNGYPGQIQMLDLATQTFRTSHEIMQFTRVSKKESYSTMIVPSTTHFDYLDTQLGSLMVTVDVRRGEDSDADASLKFWEWDAEASVYRLSAQVDRPHGSARVTSAIFSPSSFQSVRNSQQQGLKAASSVAQTSSSPSFTCSCATSATDGSIKIWIGQSQQSSKDGSRSEANAVGMHWSCSFSFKHRDCLAGALSYSFDGSLLAISYENVVTLWDPSQVQLWRSIVAPTRHNVTFTAFIEPRASVAMGGGAGEAMLVVGASRSLSVYDLMTMKMMWSVEGYFSCFAVAANESAAVRCEGSSSSSKSSSLTWIAASVMKKNSRGTNYSEYTDMEGQSGKTIQGPNKILLFSCYSPKPLCVQKLRSTASSMTFWSNQRDVTSSLSSGLVVLTVQGEVLVVGASDALKQHFSDRSHPSSLIAQAKVFGQKLPTLPFSAVMHSYNQSSVESADGGDGMPPLPGPLSSSAIQVAGPAKGWLEGMFDSASGSIPPLSAIYDDFVGGLLNKQQTGASEDSPQSSASTSSSSKAYAGPTSSGARSKVTKVDDESIFSETRQQMFTEGLSTFFSDFVQSSAAAAVVASKAPKSAVKTKKTDKRKADVL